MFRLVALFLALVSASAVVAPGHVASVLLHGLNARWDFGPASALVLSCLVFHSVHNSFVRGLFEGSLNKWWGSIVFIFFRNCGGRAGGLGDDVFQVAELLGSNLLENLWHHVLEVLGLGVSLEHQKLLTEGVLNLGLADVQNSVVVTEHVALVDVRDGLGIKLLDGGVELPVFSDDYLSNVLVMSTLGSFSSDLGLAEPGLHSFSGFRYFLSSATTTLATCL